MSIKITGDSLSTPWKTWTPTLGTDFIDPTSYNITQARYQRINNTVFYRFAVSIISVYYTANGAMTFSLPVTASYDANHNHPIGNATMRVSTAYLADGVTGTSPTTMSGVAVLGTAGSYSAGNISGTYGIIQTPITVSGKSYSARTNFANSLITMPLGNMAIGDKVLVSGFYEAA